MILALMLLGCTGRESNFVAEAPVIDLPIDDLWVVAYPVGNLPGGTPLPVRVPALSLMDNPLIALREALEIDGTLTGRGSTPLPRASLPGTDRVATGVIHSIHPEALERRLFGTDELGAFSFVSLPGEQQITVVPDDVRLAMQTLALTLTSESDRLDLALDGGAPIWGRIDRSRPTTVPAQVRLVNADGVRSATTFTDANGWYELRATPGERVQVESLSNNTGIEPRILTADVLVTPEGARVDVLHPVPEIVTLSMRATAAGTVRALPWRLTSRRLSNHPAGATLERTGFSDTTGNIAVQLVAGSYTLELLPTAEQPWSSVVRDLQVDEDVNLADVRLPSLAPVSGFVLSPSGQPVNGAYMTCRETASGARSWSGVSDANGVLGFDAPQSALTCILVPPEERGDLATRILELPRQGGDNQVFALSSGLELAGRIEFRDTPVELALVEIQTADGDVLTSDLTDRNGRFEIRVGAY